MGGSHRTMVRSPCGDPSSVTAVTGIPMRVLAASSGWEVVADAKMMVGVAP